METYYITLTYYVIAYLHSYIHAYIQSLSQLLENSVSMERERTMEMQKKDREAYRQDMYVCYIQCFFSYIVTVVCIIYCNMSVAVIYFGLWTCCCILVFAICQSPYEWDAPQREGKELQTSKPGEKPSTADERSRGTFVNACIYVCMYILLIAESFIAGPSKRAASEFIIASGT